MRLTYYRLQDGNSPAPSNLESVLQDDTSALVSDSAWQEGASIACQVIQSSPATDAIIEAARNPARVVRRVTDRVPTRRRGNG